MICYKDMTFCSAKCKNTYCARNYTEDDAKGAREWWDHDPENAPVAFSDFSASCLHYQPKETT